MNLPKRDLLTAEVAAQPYPLVFATVSGAHLYGFESADSDFDLRGVHVLPKEALLGLDKPVETISRTHVVEGTEVDIVTHDIRKFMLMLLKRNGYVLEQLLSPLVVQSSPAHEELLALAPRCLTRHHVNHYMGFAQTELRLFQKEDPPRVKPLLYLYRVLLTGIHLMRTGTVEANLGVLWPEYRLPFIADLIAIKRGGVEKQTLVDADLAFHLEQVALLEQRLQREGERTTLPDVPTAKPELNDLLVRLRTSF